jgi:hypothetical protein
LSGIFAEFNISRIDAELRNDHQREPRQSSLFNIREGASLGIDEAQCTETYTPGPIQMPEVVGFGP